MNIIKYELKSNIKGFITWTIALGLLFFAASFEYEAFANNPQIAEFVDNYDYMFNAIAGMTIDITTPEGYLSLISLYIYLPLGIYSALLGSNIISKEERDRTAEYLFTLPIKRSRVLTRKVIVALIYSLLINVSIMTITYFAFSQLGTSDSYNQFVLNIGIGVFITQLIFLSIGFALSAVLKQYKKSGAITIGILMGTFMLHILIGFVEEIEFLKYLTPFQYFKVEMMLNNNFQISFIIISTFIVFGGFYTLYHFYKRRDLYI